MQRKFLKKDWVNMNVQASQCWQCNGTAFKMMHSKDKYEVNPQSRLVPCLSVWLFGRLHACQNRILYHLTVRVFIALCTLQILPISRNFSCSFRLKHMVKLYRYMYSVLDSTRRIQSNTIQIQKQISLNRICDIGIIDFAQGFNFFWQSGSTSTSIYAVYLNE